MQRISLLLLFITITSSAIACDICGSGAGGGYMGILPGFKKRFISLRYSHNSLTSHLGPDGRSTYLTASERFQVIEAWGAANIGKRFRVTAFVPLNMMQRNDGTGSLSQSGLGDISATGYYQLFAKEQTTGNDKLLLQSLWIGAGLKLPTGRYNAIEKNAIEGSQNSFQLGTGSIDYTVNTMYDIRLQDAGINLNASYKMNARNKDDYQYGNKFTANMLAYYKWRIKNISLAPNIGVLFEQSSKDSKTKGIEVWQTGGYSLMGTVGLECSMGRVGVGANFQTPFSQQLGEGKLRANDRGMVYVSVSL